MTPTRGRTLRSWALAFGITLLAACDPHVLTGVDELDGVGATEQAEGGEERIAEFLDRGSRRATGSAHAPAGAAHQGEVPAPPEVAGEPR